MTEQQQQQLLTVLRGIVHNRVGLNLGGHYFWQDFGQVTELLNSSSLLDNLGSLWRWKSSALILKFKSASVRNWEMPEVGGDACHIWAASV